MRKYYAIETSPETRSASIAIFGEITSFPLFKSDVSAWNIQNEINALDVDTIEVHINSYGGEVAEALAITNTLIRHPAKVNTYVDGFACSAATIIFMSGDERIVSPASNFLVHPASSCVFGNAEEMRREAANLDSITAQSVNMYMKGVTKSREELIELMAQEKFLTPEETLDWGFATKIDDFGQGTNPTQSVARLVSSRLHDAPGAAVRIDESQIAEICAMVAKELGAAPQRTEPEPPAEPKPQSMLDRFLAVF